MDSGKAADVTDVVAVEEVATVEEDVVEIQITPTMHGTVLASDIFIRISAVLIWMLFRETFYHMLAIDTAVESLVADMVTKAHAGGVEVA